MYPAAFIFIPALVLGGLTVAANAQLVVWHDDFQSVPPGPYDGHPGLIITNDFPLGTNAQNLAWLFDASPGTTLNIVLETHLLPATGNSNPQPAAYTLEFDIAVQRISLNRLGGFVGPSLGLFGPGSDPYYGQHLLMNIPVSFFPDAGMAYEHVSMPLDSFPNANSFHPTNAAFSFFIGLYIAGQTNGGTEEIDLGDVYILMNTNPSPIPRPTMKVLPAKPGLRVFAQNNQATCNQEGFGTVDLNQSWIGVATPANPVSYSITIGDFDTVNNYTLYVQFVQNANPGDPFGVYNGANALVWNITHQGTGFTTAVNWKTNMPASGQPSNALPTLVTTSLDGRGTWKLTFTNDTDGTVVAPDGTSGSFTLPNNPTWAAAFANPVIIDFGTSPNNPAGYGQWITFNKIAISNVVDGASMTTSPWMMS